MLFATIFRKLLRATRRRLSVPRAADDGNVEGFVVERDHLSTSYDFNDNRAFTAKRCNAVNVPFGCADQAAKELAERKAMAARDRKERQAKESAKAKR